MQAPFITTLAAVSPDGRAYAYADSLTTPSAIMVVAADGSRREPFALPLTALASAAPGANPFEPLRSWFAASYTWQTDRTGKWDIVPRRPMGPVPSMTTALERLFTDATDGYRHCFAAENPHCLPGWKLAGDPEVLTGSCCNSPSTYAPTKPVTAFGARVVALSFRRLSFGNSGYALVSDGDAAGLATALEQRLREQKIPFVRADRCPDLAANPETCKRQLVDTINWQPSGDPSMLWQILDAAEKNIVFLTPTLAIGLFPDEGGRVWIMPLARYAMPP